MEAKAAGCFDLTAERANEFRVIPSTQQRHPEP
jgi:hypothetical protein